MLIGQSEEKIIALGGGIIAQGDLKQTLEAIKIKYNSRQFAKIADTLTKYYEAIHAGKAISDIEGIYNAKAYHILAYISEKINNDEMLNSFEEDALDLIIDIMKSAQGSDKNIYHGLFSKKGWEQGKISGIAPFYKIFLSKIAKTLYRNGIINSDPDTKLITSVQELTIAIRRAETDLWRRIFKMENGELWGATEDFLSEIYVSLENLISSCLPKSASYNVINAIQQDFDFLYFVQGDMSKNKFYGEARLLINKISDIISSTTTIPNYDGTKVSLNGDVLIGVNIIDLYKNLKDARKPPSLEIVAHLRASIVDNLKPYITSAQLDKILYLVDEYKASILSYHDGIDLLDVYRNGYRKVLIKDLINSKITPILQQSYSLNSLSDLLFGDRYDLKDNFFYNNKEEIYRRPDLYILRHIKLRVSLWTTEDFKSEGHIDQTTLDSLKEEIITKIDKFISGEKIFEYFLKGQVSVLQAFNYLNKKYVVLGYEGELEMIQAFHRAVTAFTGDSKISNDMLGEIIELSRFSHASEGHRFSIDTFKKMVGFLEMLTRGDTSAFIPPIAPKYDFMSRLTLDQRQEIYEDAKKAIKSYMKEFGMERPKNWNAEHVEANHVFKLLKRNLGMEILSFTTLDKSIFIKIKGKIQNFARHHFRSDFFRKLSTYVKDLILTDNKNHNKYKSYSEAQMLVILNGFDKMMEMEGTGKDSAITKNDVINIFEENEWVLYGLDRENGEDGWFNSREGFDEMLIEFNYRKNLLKNKGLLEFIREKYDTVYERFYINLPDGTANADGFHSLIAPHPWLGDYAMWIDNFAGFWLPDF